MFKTRHHFVRSRRLLVRLLVVTGVEITPAGALFDSNRLIHKSERQKPLHPSYPYTSVGNSKIQRPLLHVSTRSTDSTVALPREIQ